MADPIDLALKRAEQNAAPKRFGGKMQLPSGAIAMVDLPAPMTPVDALALVVEFGRVVASITAINEAPSEEAKARSRLVLPS